MGIEIPPLWPNEQAFGRKRGSLSTFCYGMPDHSASGVARTNGYPTGLTSRRFFSNRNAMLTHSCQRDAIIIGWIDSGDCIEQAESV